MGVEAAIIGSAVLGAGASAYSASKQAGAAKRAGAVQAAANEKAAARLEPYVGAGTNALAQTMNLLGLGEEGGAEKAYATLRESPGYQFRLDEGQRVLEGSAAARGNLFSGNTLTDLVKYGQDYGSNELMNYFNQLGSVRTGGQNAAAGQGVYDVGAGQAIGGGMRSAAAAYGGMAENLASGFNAATENMLMAQILQNGGGGSTAGPIHNSGYWGR